MNVEAKPHIGLDIDGTITADIEFFAGLSRRARAESRRVHIVSSRSPAGEVETRAELAQHGVLFDALYLLPGFGQRQLSCPIADLDWYGRYLWQKVEYAVAHGIGVFYDDDPRVLALFARCAPGVVLNQGWDRTAKFGAALRSSPR